MRRLFSSLVLITTLVAGIHRANAAAIDDVKITVSNQGCDGFDPSARSFVVYAENQNISRTISATLQYDSNPPSQSFSLWDANISAYTDRFPKNLEIRIAPGATVPVGCTINYRPSATPLSVNMVPIVVSLIGASYVRNNAPPVPPEDAFAFSAFILQSGFSACGSGGRPAGLFYLQNLHPYARLFVTIALVDGHSTNNDRMSQDLAPLSATRIGCSNGFGSPFKVVDARLIYPPGQKTATERTPARKEAPSFVSPFQK